MTNYRVLLQAIVTQWAEIEIDDGALAELKEAGTDPREYAADNAQGSMSLCWHCARTYELGDFELVNGDLDEIVQEEG